MMSLRRKPSYMKLLNFKTLPLSQKVLNHLIHVENRVNGFLKRQKDSLKNSQQHKTVLNLLGTRSGFLQDLTKAQNCFLECVYEIKGLLLLKLFCKKSL